MILLGLSLIGFAGFVYVHHKFPKPPEADTFDLPMTVTKGASIIAGKPETEKRDGITFYKFKCKIDPDKALMPDGTTIKMRVPDEFKIKEFIVGADADNIVHWVHLGEHQYHCDKHMDSNCFYLQYLYKEELSYEFLYKLIELLETYCQSAPMNIDHWHNPKFEKMNKPLIQALEVV